MGLRFHNRPCIFECWNASAVLAFVKRMCGRVFCGSEIYLSDTDMRWRGALQSRMLSLVDYAGSDEDDFDEAQDEECIHAEVVSNRKRRLTSAIKDDETVGGSRQQDDSAMGEYDSVTNTEGGLSILTNLPPTVSQAGKIIQEEKELDDLVKRKDWELKLAKKTKKKRKRHSTHHTNNGSESNQTSMNLASNRTKAKKMVVIQAFSGLKGLSCGKEKECDEQPDHSKANSSANLLAVLPEPKNASGISRKLNLFASNSKHFSGNTKMHEVLGAEEVSKQTKFADEEYNEESDEDHDSTDFFGLKAIDNPLVAPNITSASDISRGKKHEQVELVDDMKVENNISAFISDPEITEECRDASSTAMSSGAIDDSQALCMIYSRDIAHLGGTVSNAAEAMENMVDVSVDQVLGPNVRATLLKNLHNKSVAEATLSHLANIPKSKDALNMVARRKHQITYLASIAVAREEQLAEQWSVNRHNKRTSARKYGF
ncbi:unnamed protein product [Litomosoides sigmodontis]|uniref:Uncharacterized protein n=1 Tax=Litomosoides sigmodontis TaxID=42156 RepID=A0A3P6TBI2_LITSI|nr:unnamed protein product [Litomosoides sigmodontis]